MGADAGRRDKEMRTPLHLAARKGNEKIVKTMIEFGHNVGLKVSV